jgi:hypothetical protein
MRGNPDGSLSSPGRLRRRGPGPQSARSEGIAIRKGRRSLSGGIGLTESFSRRRVETPGQSRGRVEPGRPCHASDGTWRRRFDVPIDFSRAATGCTGSVDLRRRPLLLGRRRLAAPRGAAVRIRRHGAAKALGLAGGADRLWVRPGGGHRDRHRLHRVRGQQRRLSARLLQRLDEQQLKPRLPLLAAVTKFVNRRVSEPI